MVIEGASEAPPLPGRRNAFLKQNIYIKRLFSKIEYKRELFNKKNQLRNVNKIVVIVIIIIILLRGRNSKFPFLAAKGSMLIIIYVILPFISITLSTQKFSKILCF